MAIGLGSRPESSRLRKANRITKLPRPINTGVFGIETSRKVPVITPIRPVGSRRRISDQATCLKFSPPSTSEEVKSVSRMSGTTKVSGSFKASRGTATRPEPKPEMPRMK